MTDMIDAISILYNKGKERLANELSPQQYRSFLKKINVRLFCVVMFFLFAVTVLAPADRNVETLENRALNKLPELSLHTALNGEFSKNFEGFIADRVGFRTDFIMMSKNVENAYGVAMREAPAVVFSSNLANRGGSGSAAADGAPEQNKSAAQALGAGGAGRSDDLGSVGGGAGSDHSLTGPGAAPQGDAAQVGAAQGVTTLGDVEPVRAGPLLAFPDRLMELFGYSERACIRYAEVVNSYAEALEGKARVFSLVVPTAVEFVSEQFRALSDSQYAAIRTVNEHLESVCSVDAYSYLRAHKNEYVYFRTDHHWTALGAYYAYLAFCETAGFDPVTIDEYDSYELSGFWGYLYNVHPTSELRENPDTIVYYKQKEPVEVSSPLHVVYGNATYSIFIGGDSPIYEIGTSAGNGRACAVIKDSYGNAFVPWLAPHYEKILVFDPRSFKGSVTETLAEYDDVDLIVLNSVFSAGSGGFNGLISGIR